ncbi:MAG: hypothetical protein M1314_03030 [Firmicutes bacterium]|nr:hypothetical protein [Bacillota bacterium]
MKRKDPRASAGRGINSSNHSDSTTSPNPLSSGKQIARPRKTSRGYQRAVEAKVSGVRVYLASPIPTFWTSRYEKHLNAVRMYFHEAEILEPRNLFSANRCWLDAWPALLPTLDVLVFFDTPDGTIGAGTAREVTDALRHALPTFCLDAGGLHQRFTLHIVGDGRNWQRYARVRAIGTGKTETPA